MASEGMIDQRVKKAADELAIARRIVKALAALKTPTARLRVLDMVRGMVVEEAGEQPPAAE